MNDTISRQAAIDALIRKMRPHDNGDGTTTICIMTEGLVEETLNNLPPAQPERKTGRWEKAETDGESKEWVPWLCSECGYRGGRSRTRFCPNCGADMTDKEGAQNDRQNNILSKDLHWEPCEKFEEEPNENM